MGTAGEKIGTTGSLQRMYCPWSKKSGYNTLQLMAIQSILFTDRSDTMYQVSLRPHRGSELRDLKSLIDDAHSMGIRVIMDLVHSHSVKNINEGLGCLTALLVSISIQMRGEIIFLGSLCFDYGKDNVLHFLLSNCRYWMEEYRFDGYRFDGVTSMIYYNHGLEKNFTTYDDYFDGVRMKMH